MKKIFIITLIAVLAFGCKTTKSVIKEHLKTDLTMHVDSAASTNSHQLAAIDSTSVIAIFSNDHTAERITRIEFAKPDSTGKQAILSQTVTERIHDSNLNKDIKTAVNSTVSTDNKQQVTLTKKSNQKIASTVKAITTTKIGWPIPWWVYLIAIGLVIVLVFVLRRPPYVVTVITWIKKILNN